LTALQGAEVLFYPTAIGWHPQEKEQYGENQHGAWMSVMKGHAVANGVYVAAANRIGLEQYYQTWNSVFGIFLYAGPREILALTRQRENLIVGRFRLTRKCVRTGHL
jgi:N-carbamoylputrescine amidase